ncbi:hypothetical protein B0A48_15474 [Cryoendolithus antarcticus]|uniref:Uncharacterized protein n=1 Tax=Cryoendolithus antarcticus TaxID=1507870 RepID=A0A1V8SGC4_9PEZI|nr:hypothetical protein B0A48_15474 [Cryoendolithus antarcticus]
MVSEVHLDLTGIGDRIASELRDAPNDMRLDSSNMLTADDIGRSVGKAIKKRLSETKAQDGESQKSIGQLSATSLVQTQVLSKLVDAIHKKEDMALAAEDADEESTVSEANDDTGLDAASLREMSITVNVAYLEGAVSSSDFAALLSLYAYSKERLGAVSIGESYVTTD